MRPDGVVRGAIAFDSDGTQLAVGDDGGLVRVWRVGLDGSLNHQADLIGHTGAVLCLDFTPGGRTLATGGTDRTVVLWDPQTGQERLVLTGHASSLVRLQFVADGHILWSIGADGSVKRWRAEPRSNAREGRPLLMPPRKK